ncbi:MAG: nfuA [Acidimicrobiales bacterium]|jgi:Fe/S biogenesis protein NfuA|nr:nfuA [Acidimicrobiales bacterium]
MPTEAPNDTPVITVTDAARTTILGLRRAEPDPDGLALRLDVAGDDGVEFAYELTFEPLADAADDDVLFRSDDLPVLVPAAAVDSVRGATLDESETTGLVLRNPNRPEPRAKENPYPEGSVEAKIQDLLDNDINPALASHGGFATLDHVEGSTAYMLMGGGCQGCGLAAMTLTEGIKAAIEDAIPEIDRVEDVTDHAAGENPFFAPA